MREVCKHCGRSRPNYIADPTCPSSTERTSFVYCAWVEARELPAYEDTHDGQTEPSVWPPLDDEGFPF